METLEISNLSLALAFLLLAVPAGLSLIFGFGLIKSLFLASARMSVQLLLIAIFLRYLFEWNHPLLNLSWLALMVLVAVLSTVKSVGIKMGRIFLPVFASFLLSTFAVILFLNIFVIRPEHTFDARYLVVLGGMLLGNSLSGNIVGIGAFYKNLARDAKRHRYVLSLGASMPEALLPYLRESVCIALKPTLASMANVGIVTLPGMMTGGLLVGADPETAIKYQIMVMLGIVAGTSASVVLSILLTRSVCFDSFGIPCPEIFSETTNKPRP